MELTLVVLQILLTLLVSLLLVRFRFLADCPLFQGRGFFFGLFLGSGYWDRIRGAAAS